jgi:hypothetical protein
MKEILKELNDAYMLLARIPVTGDSVDVLAAARTALREVWGKLQKMEAGDGPMRASGPTEEERRTELSRPTAKGKAKKKEEDP